MSNYNEGVLTNLGERKLNKSTSLNCLASFKNRKSVILSERVSRTNKRKIRNVPGHISSSNCQNVSIDDISDEDIGSQKKIKVVNKIADVDSDDDFVKGSDIGQTACILNVSIDDEEREGNNNIDWLNLEDSFSPIKATSSAISVPHLLSQTAQFVKLKPGFKPNQKKYAKQSVINSKEVVGLQLFKHNNDLSPGIPPSRNGANGASPFVNAYNLSSPDFKLKSSISNKVFNKCDNIYSQSDEENTPKKVKPVLINDFTPPKDKSVLNVSSRKIVSTKVYFKSICKKEYKSSEIFKVTDNSCDSLDSTPPKQVLINDFSPYKIDSNVETLKMSPQIKSKCTVSGSNLATSVVRKNIFSNILTDEFEDFNSDCTLEISKNCNNEIPINESTPEKVCPLKERLGVAQDVDDFESSVEEELPISEATIDKISPPVDGIDSQPSPISSGCQIECLQSPHKNTPLENNCISVDSPIVSPKKQSQEETDQVYLLKNKKKRLKGKALVQRALTVVKSLKLRNKLSLYELEVGLNSGLILTDPVLVQFSWTESDSTYLKCSKLVVEETKTVVTECESFVPLPESIIVVVSNCVKTITTGVEIKLSHPLKVFTHSDPKKVIAVTNYVQVLDVQSGFIFKNNTRPKAVPSDNSYFTKYRLPDLFLTSFVPSPCYRLFKNSSTISLRDAHLLFPFYFNFSIEMTVHDVFKQSGVCLLASDREGCHCLIRLPIHVRSSQVSNLIAKKGKFSGIILNYLESSLKHPFPRCSYKLPLPTPLYHALTINSWTVLSNFTDLDN